MEGIFFIQACGVVIPSSKPDDRHCEQFQYILRDETIHLTGLDLINGIKAENPELWTEQLQQEMIDRVRKSVELINYAKDCLPNGVMGLMVICSGNTYSTSPTDGWNVLVYLLAMEVPTFPMDE